MCEYFTGLKMPFSAYFFEDHIAGIREVPFGIMRLEFGDVGNIPDMVAYAIRVLISIYRLFPENIFRFLDGFKHRYVGLARTPSVIRFSGTRILMKMPEHVHQVVGM